MIVYRFKIEYTNGDWGYLYRWENVTLKKGDELFYTLRGRRMELTDDPKIANMNLNERIEYFSKKEQK